MHRVLDLGLPLFQIAIRSNSPEEVVTRRDPQVGKLDATDIAHRGVPRTILPASFPKNIYITFDVDAFDPSLVPGTGTPEPGGLFWWDALDLLEKVIRGREVLGFDVVELSPIPGMHTSEFVAAKLVYAIIGMIVRQGRP
jgi:agmatinase